MLKVVLHELQLLQQRARELDVETCAAALVLSAGERDGAERYVVRELTEVPEAAYLRRSAAEAVLMPEFCIELANRARSSGAGVLLAHTHVGVQTLEGFSTLDDAGEQDLSKYFNSRLPGLPHFAAVVTARSAYARRLGKHQLVPVVGVGRTLEMPTSPTTADQSQYDRQVRAFGVQGQQALQQISVAIVGQGGTGSVVAQQLAYLGVRDFVLIDPDQVEMTNLNRLVGARLQDVGKNKVEVAARHIKEINPEARCLTIAGDILDGSVAKALTTVDFIFGCTDSMGSRAVLNQLAHQYMVPCIDMGVAIGTFDGKVQYVTGRTQMISPGLACLVCTEKLDAEQVRRDLMSEQQRRRDPYIVGTTVAQPAVISLNSTMSSAAITMFLAAVTGSPSEARMVIYDGVRGSLRPAAMSPRAHCIACSYDGALARGASWQLPRRATNHD